MVALGDSSFRVESRAGLELESIVNPTLLPQATVQRVNALTASFFSTYGDRSSVSLLAAAGDVTLLEDPARDGGLTGELTSMNLQLSGATAPFSILPGHFSAVALNGSLHAIGNPIGLWSSPSGNLDLLAARDVTFGASQTLSMSDAAPDLLATPAAPAGNLNTTELAIFAAPPPGNAHAPIHSGAPSGGPVDATQARIVASAGDIVNANITYMPKPIDIVAGRDITGLSADIEQFDPTQLSLISAGRDISYPFPRDPLSGVLLPDFSGVVVEGSGRLAVEAGRNINLGTSAGITAAGNLSNPSLSAAGADVSLLAGATAANADVGDFVSRYLAGSGGYDAALIAFVAGATGKAPGSKSAALAAFAQLSREQQFAFCQQVLFDELRSSGRSAAGPGAGHDDYTRGFTALETLFPHSTGAAPAGGATQAYPGDISLYFSRIYSLSSGSISLLAPGGAVDVGIAALPTAFGLTKQPSDLGIVVEGSGSVSSVSYADFLVNQSRVFAADGGNILVWSTQGNIDAGRGAKTAISAPPPTVSFDAQGHLVTVFPAVLTGSGIQALATAAGVNPGDVDSFAPNGVVNAGDAGIFAGNLTIGATAVLGRDNITVSGVAVGVPVDTSGLGASLSGSSAVASSASSAATMSVGSAGAQERSAPLAESALSWLDVFVEGFGEEVCKPSDQECLQRQKRK